MAADTRAAVRAVCPNDVLSSIEAARSSGVAEAEDAALDEDIMSELADFHSQARPRAQLQVHGWRRASVTASMQEALHDVQIEAKVKEAARQDTSTVITEVTSKATVGQVPLWMQGNAKMAELDNLRKRFALRRHPLVLEALEKWWRTAQFSMQQAGGDGYMLTREEYMQVFSRIFTVMVEDDFDPDEAMSTAEEDWASDAKGGNFMRRSDFLDSLFELADVWTEEIDAQEYADFLNLTFKTVSEVFPQGSAWRRIVRPGHFHVEQEKVVAAAKAKAKEEKKRMKEEAKAAREAARAKTKQVTAARARGRRAAADWLLLAAGCWLLAAGCRLVGVAAWCRRPGGRAAGCGWRAGGCSLLLPLIGPIPSGTHRPAPRFGRRRRRNTRSTRQLPKRRRPRAASRRAPRPRRSGRRRRSCRRTCAARVRGSRSPTARRAAFSRPPPPRLRRHAVRSSRHPHPRRHQRRSRRLRRRSHHRR